MFQDQISRKFNQLAAELDKRYNILAKGEVPVPLEALNNLLQSFNNIEERYQLSEKSKDWFYRKVIAKLSKFAHCAFRNGWSMMPLPFNDPCTEKLDCFHAFFDEYPELQFLAARTLEPLFVVTFHTWTKEDRLIEYVQFIYWWPQQVQDFHRGIYHNSSVIN